MNADFQNKLLSALQHQRHQSPVSSQLHNLQSYSNQQLSESGMEQPISLPTSFNPYTSNIQFSVTGLNNTTTKCCVAGVFNRPVAYGTNSMVGSVPNLVHSNLNQIYHHLSPLTKDLVYSSDYLSNQQSSLAPSIPTVLSSSSQQQQQQLIMANEDLFIQQALKSAIQSNSTTVANKFSVSFILICILNNS